MSSISYFTIETATEGFKHLGFPDYFRVELAIAKLIGAIVLTLPFFKERVKEWAYAGFSITFISATFAHVSVHDEMGKIIAPLIIFLLLLTSYYFKRKMAALSIDNQS